MSDILFRFLVMARRRDQSSWRRLFLVDEPLLESGVEQLVESAAARVVVTSQHERVSRRNHTVPASRHRRVQFHEVARPNRPTPEHFERRSESFPLQGTLKIYTCSSCSGRGQGTCGSCFGQGQARCRSCRGSGRLRGHNRRNQRCGSCGGSGSSRCSSCHGSGELPCRTCSGEGQMASWEEEVYDYRIENRTSDQYPLAKPPVKLRGAFTGWLKIDRDLVADFEPGTATEHLGFESPEALQIVAHAREDRQRLEKNAQDSGDRYLFHETARSLAPVGYSVVRRAGQAFYYWLVGRGDKALEIRPPGRIDWRKLGGWLGLTTLPLFGYEVLLRLFGPWNLLSLEVLMDLSLPALAGAMAASGALLLNGLPRWLKRPTRVETLGLFHQTGEPTSLLACLAYLGSYTGRLSVVDRAYTTQTERLLGKSRPGHQSETLAVELADGRKVYLIEVAQPQELSDHQLSSLLESLDGVVVLEDTVLEDTVLEDIDARLEGPTFESRIRDLARESTRIMAARIDRGPNLNSSDALPLEAIRNAFLEHFQADVDWHALFARIWHPVARSLGDSPESHSPEPLDTERPSTSLEVAARLKNIDSRAHDSPAHDSPAHDNHESTVENPEPLHLAS